MSENDKITVKGIDRQRAVLAYDCVTEVDEQSNGKKKKEYKSYIKKMPSLIKTNGLGHFIYPKLRERTMHIHLYSIT